MSVSSQLNSRAGTGWGVLLAVLIVESFGGLALMVPVVTAFLAAAEDPLGPRLSVMLAAILAWAWVLLTLWGAARSRASWSRGSALTMHVLMFAAGTGVLQLGGLVGSPLLGWGLIALALVGFVGAIIAKPAIDPLEAEMLAAGDSPTAS